MCCARCESCTGSDRDPCGLRPEARVLGGQLHFTGRHEQPELTTVVGEPLDVRPLHGDPRVVQVAATGDIEHSAADFTGGGILRLREVRTGKERRGHDHQSPENEWEGVTHKK